MSKSWVISKFIGTPFLERQVTWNILEHTCCLSVVSWQCPKGNLDARCLSGGGPSYAGIEQNSNHHQLSLKNSGDIMIYLSYQKKNNVSLEARTTEHFSKPGHHLAAYVIVVSPKICAQIRLRSHGPIEREVDLPTKNGDVP